MEIFRRAANPWNQEVLIGISWDIMWAAAWVGLAFVVFHALFVWGAGSKSEEAGGGDGNEAGVGERVERHGIAARVFHWIMALSMLVLLITAFFPVLGIQFAWVTIHWMAGVLLILSVAYHVVHATLVQDFWSMGIGGRDVGEVIKLLKGFLSRTDGHTKAGKYPADHKLYHHVIVVVTGFAIITGILMMVRVDTPFWTRNPYLLADSTWGVVYVLHGLSGVALITMVMAHIYFAIRPEKLWITRSMVYGWIRREDFLLHHDPGRWVVSGTASTDVPPLTSGAGVAEAVPQDSDPAP